MGFMTPMEKLARFDIKLPPVSGPAGLYKPALIDGEYLYFSGHLPTQIDGSIITGKLGHNTTIEEGKKAAMQVGLNILSTVCDLVGSLNRVACVLKLTGYVNATDDFIDHPQVINGCSELFEKIWGKDFGVGVRSAFGATGLPAGATVEIDGIFKLHTI